MWPECWHCQFWPHWGSVPQRGVVAPALSNSSRSLKTRNQFLLFTCLFIFEIILLPMATAWNNGNNRIHKPVRFRESWKIHMVLISSLGSWLRCWDSNWNSPCSLPSAFSPEDRNINLSLPVRVPLLRGRSWLHNDPLSDPGLRMQSGQKDTCLLFSHGQFAVQEPPNPVPAVFSWLLPCVEIELSEGCCPHKDSRGL